MSGGESGQYPGLPAVGERSGLNLDGTPCRPAGCAQCTPPPGELTLAGPKLSGDTVVLVARVGCTLVVAWTLADLAAADPNLRS